MVEYVAAECPACGWEIVPVSVEAEYLSRDCRCGTVWKLDPGTGDVEVLRDP